MKCPTCENIFDPFRAVRNPTTEEVTCPECGRVISSEIIDLEQRLDAAVTELNKKEELIAEISKRLRDEKVTTLAAIEESLKFQDKIIELELEVKKLRLWKK